MAANGGHGSGNHPLRWTSPMSGFMLRRFVELMASGVKTEKGFKGWSAHAQGWTAKGWSARDQR